jgi:hypothetical protein
VDRGRSQPGVRALVGVRVCRRELPLVPRHHRTARERRVGVHWRRPCAWPRAESACPSAGLTLRCRIDELRWSSEGSCQVTTDPRLQLELFASSEPSDKSELPSSPSSTARSTRSSATHPTGDATRTGSMRPAQEPSPPGSAAPAGRSPGGASSTEAAAQLPMPTTITGAAAPDPMLALPRPRNRSECRPGASERMAGNPCPWVGCRYHLLLEVANAKPRANRDARPTTIRLNSRVRRRTGRRPGLSSSAAEALVRVWLDDAMELLFTLEWSCALDVADAYPDGLHTASVGALFGVTRQDMQQEIHTALRRGSVRESMRDHRRDEVE